MKEENKRSILKAHEYAAKLQRHIAKLENNSARESEYEFSKALDAIYLKLNDYENEGLCKKGLFTFVRSALKANKMFMLFNRITKELTDYNNENIFYVNLPNNEIKSRIFSLAEPNKNADWSKDRKEIINKDYKLLKTISKELEQ